MILRGVASCGSTIPRAEIQRDGKTFGVRHVSIQILEEEISSGHLRGGGSVPGMAC